MNNPIIYDIVYSNRLFLTSGHDAVACSLDLFYNRRNLVIPAYAGVTGIIPAFAGMTKLGNDGISQQV